MESTDKKRFDKVVWMGREPLNQAREKILSQLLVFLGYTGEIYKVYSPGSGRQLLLGNAEDYSADWPRPDGSELFVGLLSSKFPNSEALLRNFEDFQVSFYIDEAIQLPEIHEYLEDLLLA